MKKPYTKPAIYVESFSLCEHIASNCTVIADTVDANYLDKTSCKFMDRSEDGGVLVIYMNSEICSGMDLGLYDSPEAYAASIQCYNSFSNMGSMFAS